MPEIRITIHYKVAQICTFTRRTILGILIWGITVIFVQRVATIGVINEEVFEQNKTLIKLILFLVVIFLYYLFISRLTPRFRKKNDDDWETDTTPSISACYMNARTSPFHHDRPSSFRPSSSNNDTVTPTPPKRRPIKSRHPNIPLVQTMQFKWGSVLLWNSGKGGEFILHVSQYGGTPPMRSYRIRQQRGGGGEGLLISENGEAMRIRRRGEREREGEMEGGGECVDGVVTSDGELHEDEWEDIEDVDTQGLARDRLGYVDAMVISPNGGG